MKPRADYDRIAERYDHDRRRYATSADVELASWAAARRSRAVVVDVGCGTGTWLAAQRPPPSVLRVGLDASEGMLRAVSDGDDVCLVRGVAERLPFPSGSVSWLESRFAIAHLDEPVFLAEAMRVLEPEGRLRIVSVLPPFDAAFAIYDFFPAARSIDEIRFPSPQDMVKWMGDAGFEAIETLPQPYRTEWQAADFVEMLAGRTASQLDLLDDEEFSRGVSRAQVLAVAEPAAVLVDEGSVWTFRAHKP